MNTQIEDVKESYSYLESTPTHSYMRYLYKYPQAALPYAQLVEENRRRDKHSPEFELMDTGVFGDNRCFDVVVEYAKNSPEEFLLRINITNHGPDPAAIDVLPTVRFRNAWSWRHTGHPRPTLRDENSAIAMDVSALGRRQLYCDGGPELLFTENQTNLERLFGVANNSPCVKDGINDCIVHGTRDAVNPVRVGTKVAARYLLSLAPGETQTIRLRL